MAETFQGRSPREPEIVEKRSDSVPQTPLNSIGEDCRPGGECGVGKGTGLNLLLFGNAFKAGSGVMWEKLVSLFHCHSSFWIHFNAAGNYIFHQTWVWMAFGYLPNILPQSLKPRISQHWSYSNNLNAFEWWGDLWHKHISSCFESQHYLNTCILSHSSKGRDSLSSLQMW